MPYYVFECPAHGDFEIKQEMMVYHEAICPICNGPTRRVYLPLTHYWPDVLFDKHGKKQSSDNLPIVPSVTIYTHGWRPPNKEGSVGN